MAEHTARVIQPSSRNTTATEHEAPHTIEGWFVLHEQWHVDWTTWLDLPEEERFARVAGFRAWFEANEMVEGGSACYAVTGQKADLLFIHQRRRFDDLHQADLSLRRLQMFCHLRPAGSFISVIEASLYEATAVAHGILARRGITPEKDTFNEALERELAVQKSLLEERVYRPIPSTRHVCFYPMSKRRGEEVNWYTLSMDDRRRLMRGHGHLGARYKDQVVQVVSGAIGLDDWEWGVDLHSDDPLLFKKLIYAMRFDEASAKYAEFGTFVVGNRIDGEGLERLLLGG